MNIREFLLDDTVEWCTDSRAVREEFAGLISESAVFDEEDRLGVLWSLNRLVKQWCAAYLVTPPEDQDMRAPIKYAITRFAQRINEAFREG